MAKRSSVFGINHSKLIVKLVDDEVSTVAIELELLKMFMNEILNQTSLYAQQKNFSLNVTKNKLWVVFGVFLLSG